MDATVDKFLKDFKTKVEMKAEAPTPPATVETKK
jgi:hypothetical protein